MNPLLVVDYVFRWGRVEPVDHPAARRLAQEVLTF